MPKQPSHLGNTGVEEAGPRDRRRDGNHRHAAQLPEQDGRVGAEADERGMPQRELARAATHDVPRGREAGEEHQR